MCCSSGAAQGLSEVLGGLGEDAILTMLPELIRFTNHKEAMVS